MKYKDTMIQERREARADGSEAFSTGDLERLATLPEAIAVPMREALELYAGAPPADAAIAEDAYRNLKVTRSPARSNELDHLLWRAFEAAGWPSYDQLILKADELSAEQRTLAELVASRVDLSLHRFAIPQTSWARRRWLGLDPPGALERNVEATVEGESRNEPLWLALTLLDRAGDEEQAVALLEALPLKERVEALIELQLGAYRVDPPSLRDFASIDNDNDNGRWAPALADRLTALFAPDASFGERGGHARPSWEAQWWVFLGLVRSGVPIEPRWDALLPLPTGKMAALGRRCVAAIPPERRGAALAAALAPLFPRDAVRGALELLPEFPSPELLEHALERTDGLLGFLAAMPRREALRRLRDAVAAHPELAQKVDERLASLGAATSLRRGRVLHPKHVRELSDVQRAQLTAMGGVGNAGDLETIAEEEGLEPGALAYLSLYEIVDEGGHPAYDVALFLDEDGVAYRAGTTERAAYICQMQIDCPDPTLLEALHEVLRDRPRET